MNSTNLNRLFKFFCRFKHFKKTDIGILSDLLESELDDHEIENILNLDLKNDQLIRTLLNKTYYGYYTKLNSRCDRRKALQVILYTLKLNKNLKTKLYKSLAYPTMLFLLSLSMLIFSNFFLFKLFRSMLQFLGPNLDIDVYQIFINIFILIDIFIILSGLMCFLLIKLRPLAFYDLLQKGWKKNLWAKIVSHQFSEKFIYFYTLGLNIDQILELIKWSSGPVLYHYCHFMISSLNEGNDLVQAIGWIDKNLQTYFRMNQEGIDILRYLTNHNKIQEKMMFQQISIFGKGALMYSYFKILFMIVTIYQVMLKPIEMMEHLL